MGVVILSNTVGAKADDCDILRDTTGQHPAPSWVDPHDMLSGPRSTRVRTGTIPDTRVERLRMEDSTETTAVDYMVVIRADWLGEAENAIRVYKNWYTSPSYSGYNFDNYIVITNETLIGPYAQDYVVSYDSAPVTGYGFAIELYRDDTGDRVYQVSKLFFSSALTLGTEPKIGEAGWERVDVEFTPLEGSFAYACERRFTLTWEWVTKTKLEAFLALPQLTNWPLVLYDSGGDVIPWKLEHCLVENFQYQLMAKGYYKLTAAFLRLRHYDIL